MPDAMGEPPRIYDRFYAGGQWVETTGDGFIDVVNPATEEIAGRVAEGTPADVDVAVAAAKKAFPAWSSTSVPERIKWLTKLRDALIANKQRAVELSAPPHVVRSIHAGAPPFIIECIVDALGQFPFEEHFDGQQKVTICKEDPVLTE